MSVFPRRDQPPIHVVRVTDLVTDRQARDMCVAIDAQVRRDFCPAHDLAPTRVRFSRADRVSRTDRVIALVDDAGEGALGWHTEGSTAAGDSVYGTVGVKPVLDHGGQVLTGALSVSTVLSHEVLELLLNPSVSLWADTGRGYLVAREACDACQGDSYEIEGVTVSDFLLPDWFSPNVSPGDRFDFLGKIAAPFQVAPGGYTLRCQGGKITEEFGATPPPEWLMQRKRTLPKARTHRLTESVPV